MKNFFLCLIVASASLMANGFSVSPPSELKLLAGRGDIEGIRNLLDNGVDINDRSGGFGGSVLNWAKDHTVTAFLLENGADPNIRTAIQNMTTLMFAVKEGDLQQVILLHKTGLDINFKDDLGKDALHYSIGNLNSDITIYLLENGAHVNTQDHKGTTPLMAAMPYAEVEQVQVLLENGANIRIRNHEGKTAMDILERPNIAAEEEDIEAVRELLRSAQPNSGHVNQAVQETGTVPRDE